MKFHIKFFTDKMRFDIIIADMLCNKNIGGVFMSLFNKRSEKEAIEKEMKACLNKGFISRGNEKVPFSKTGVTLEKALPFTRAEYLAYKSKNMQSKIVGLSAVEKNIEDYLEFLMKGLSSYKNQYKEATLLEKIKFVLLKFLK